MKKMIKKIVFIGIIVALIFATGLAIKAGSFEKLEGYMYTFASEITNSATSSNATSSNATSSNATSSNATSSNATSSNATSSNATACNATSSNAQITETIKVTNTQPSTQPSVQKNASEIKEELVYNNSEITQDVIEKISNSTETQKITINIDKNVNISENIFKAIKGKQIKLIINVGENQIIFNGNNITTPKQINTEITYNLASEDTLLKEIVQEGVVINFANNGELPGIATIRIKVTDEIKQSLNMNSILVYHYDEVTKELTQIETNAIYDEEGFIEFSINHNSKYLFVNELIEEKEYTVTTNGNSEINDKVSFLESNKTYIMIIGMSVLAIIVVVVIIILDKKGIEKRKAKANNNNNQV